MVLKKTNPILPNTIFSKRRGFLFVGEFVDFIMTFKYKNLLKLIFLLIFGACSVKDSSFYNEDALILSHNNEDREYLLHIPENYDSTISHPIVFNFHGYGGTATDHMLTADFRTIADTAGFILVYPQGLISEEGSPHWNIAEGGGDNKSNSDDFGFIRLLINELSQGYNINENRIYACGYSNGAGFSFSVACHLDQFAAIASISGLMSDWALDNCDPLQPVGIMILHGTSDNVRPYSGIDNFSLSVDEEIQFWTDFNNTDSIPQISNFNDGNLIEHFFYDNGTLGSLVELYKINNGSHIWFNFSDGSENSNQLIWNFLSKHSLEENL